MLSWVNLTRFWSLAAVDCDKADSILSIEAIQDEAVGKTAGHPTRLPSVKPAMRRT